MKLLFDENLSPRLVKGLSDLFPGSQHVHTCGLGSATDAEIWKFASECDHIIVSKDSDFYHRSVRLGAPPKVIWLKLENCPTARIETIIRAFAEKVRAFEVDVDRNYLTITVRVRG